MEPLTNNPRSQRPSLPRIPVTCSVSNINNSHLNSEKPVVERRFVNQPLPKEPALHSTWSHCFWVAAGCITVLASFAKSIIGGFNSHLWLEPTLAGYAGYILADLGGGVYHWAIDNYGDESTPLFGARIQKFQGHHNWPWIIVRQQFAVRIYLLARILTFTVVPLVLVFDDPVVHGFVSSFSFCILFYHQFHAWAHETKSNLPPLVGAFQDMGLIVSRRQHAEHHRAYNSSYCMMNSVLNKVLDESHFFVALEKFIYFMFGVKPRSWTDQNSEWTEETVISNNNHA